MEYIKGKKKINKLISAFFCFFVLQKKFIFKAWGWTCFTKLTGKGMSCCSSIIDVVTSKLPDLILACAKYSYGSDGQPALETAASKHEDNIF